jgi:hypothetical protein
MSDDVKWWVPGDLPFSGTKTKAEYLQIVGSIQRGQRIHGYAASVSIDSAVADTLLHRATWA